MSAEDDARALRILMRSAINNFIVEMSWIQVPIMIGVAWLLRNETWWLWQTCFWGLIVVAVLCAAHALVIANNGD